MSPRSLEPLEARRHLSSALVSGVLKVTGTLGNDQITIDLRRPDPLGSTYVYVREAGVAIRFLLTHVSSIDVNTNAGNDLVVLKTNGLPWLLPSTVQAGDGNDAIDLRVPYGAKVFGGTGNDTISGSLGSDYIRGGEGDDILYGLIGRDRIFGDAGRDRMTGDSGNDYLEAGVDSDVDTLRGGDGEDTLRGQYAFDVIRGEAGIDDAGSFAAPGSAQKMVFAPKYGLLFLMNSGSAIHVIDTRTQQRIDLRLSTWMFTDIDLAPSGDFLFAADFGGEEIGYGYPINPSYIHRFNLATRRWEGPSRTNEVAYRLEAVDDERVLLLESDQWVDLHLERWGPLTSTLLTSAGADYYGDIEYDPVTRRIFHGNSGSSSQEIVVLRLVDDEIHYAEGTGTYGSAQGYGLGSVLSTDGSAFYYGRLKVEGLDVRHNMRVFDNEIYAASANVAIGRYACYDAQTGRAVSLLPFDTEVFAWDAQGTIFWAYNPADTTLHRFEV